MDDLYKSSVELPPKFNAGLGKVMRIHRLWEMAHASKATIGEEGSFMVWLTSLLSLKGEFIDRMKEEMEKDLEKLEEEIYKSLNNGQFNKAMKDISNYELMLHRIERKIGYSVPDQEDYGL